MYVLIQELRVAFRQLRKAPGFSLTIVLTLALGIGATTAIFSLIEGILLRPLPFSDPQRLVLLGDDGHVPLAVISYALWINRYHRDVDVLGKTIVLDRKAYTIIGVMPRSFEFPLEDGHLDQAQLWVPMSLTPEELSDEHAGFFGYQLVARLKNGVALGQAGKDAERVAQQIRRSFPPSLSAIHIRG